MNGNAPTVLLYNLDSEKGRQIKMLCLALKLREKNVSPAGFSLTVRQALDGGEARPESGEEREPFSDEMLVMANLSNAQMNQLLLGFRRKKIPTVALKAVATAANLEWDGYRLREELSAEHEAFRRGETAHPAG